MRERAFLAFVVNTPKARAIPLGYVPLKEMGLRRLERRTPELAGIVTILSVGDFMGEFLVDFTFPVKLQSHDFSMRTKGFEPPIADSRG